MEITANAVKELREKTGAGMMECKKALAESQGDPEKAVVWLRERGMAQAAKRAGRAANQGVVLSLAAGMRAVLLELNCETDFVAKTDDFNALARELAEQAAEKGAPGLGPEGLLSQPWRKDASKTLASHVTAATAKLGENLVVKRLEVAELSGPGLFGAYNHGGKVAVWVEVGLPEAAAGKAEAAALAKEMAMQVAASSPRVVSSSDVPPEEVEKERAIFLNEAKQAGKPEAVQGRIAEGKLKSHFQQICLMEQPYIREPKRSVKDTVTQAAAPLGGDVTVRRFRRFQLGE